MSVHRLDVLIVGGGPAGLAAAIVFGRNDLSVMVCEREALPRDKACGEGIMPTGVEHLAQLDAIAHLDPRYVRNLAGIRFHSAGGHVATAHFREGHGLGVRRTNLSAALLAATRRWPAIEIRHAACVRRLKMTSGGVLVQIGDDAVQARLLVGADGLHSRVRRWAGLEGPPQRLRRLGARQHFAINPCEPYVDVIQGRGIEAYVTPCGEGQVGVAFLWDPTVYREAQGGDGLIRSLMAAFPELERRFASTARLSQPIAAGPLHHLARRRAADAVILIGDAGGYIDACTGEGISIALAQAMAIEPTVVPVLKRYLGVPSELSLIPYVQACRAITRPYRIGTTLQLYLCRHPWLANRVVRALEGERDLLAHLVSANMGRVPFWPGWRATSRLLRAVLSPRPKAE
jgi:2-polyprenyl-6-methoxyphenol hydroxylase-like FAD-dependent oxidoreductase